MLRGSRSVLILPATTQTPKVPSWAQGEALAHALVRQAHTFDERHQLETFGLARPMSLAKVRRSHHALLTRVTDLP